MALLYTQIDETLLNDVNFWFFWQQVFITCHVYVHCCAIKMQGIFFFFFKLGETILPCGSETGAYNIEWNKSERETPIQYINAYICNLERQ